MRGAARRAAGRSRAEALVAGELQEYRLEVHLVGAELGEVEAALGERPRDPLPLIGREVDPKHVPVELRADARPRRARARPRRDRRVFTSRPRARPADRTSPTGPDVISRPRATIATRSAVCSTSDRMWLETKTVRPSFPSDRISSRTSTMPAGSRPFAGSSRISSAGSFRRAAAIPSRCFIPSEYVRTASAPRSASPTRASTRSIAASSYPPTRPEDLEVPPAREPGEQRRLLHDRAHRADHAGEPVRGPRRPSAACGRRSAGRDPAGIGSSWSCRRRSVPGTRRRRPREHRGRDRRPRSSCPRAAGDTPCGAPRPRSRPSGRTIPGGSRRADQGGGERI